ncbi:hypothetical protein OLM08_12025 [Enterococcus faecalis]|nr:hypothetical protein OLM08_12025 [Enterococcus faecalis]
MEAEKIVGMQFEDLSKEEMNFIALEEIITLEFLRLLLLLSHHTQVMLHQRLALQLCQLLVVLSHILKNVFNMKGRDYIG